MKVNIIVLCKGGITITTYKLNCYKHLRNSSTNEKNKKNNWSAMQIIGHGLPELHCELKKKWVYFMCMVCVPHVCLVPVEVRKMVLDPWNPGRGWIAQSCPLISLHIP